MGTFPACFPDDFVSDILPSDAAFEARVGYRVAKYGLECPVSYFSTFEERIIDGRPLEVPSRDAEMYSTSLFDAPDYPRYILSLTMRDDRRPRACLVRGHTAPECGPSKVGKEKRSKSKAYRHISWWIYEDARPWEYFEEESDGS